MLQGIEPSLRGSASSSATARGARHACARSSEGLRETTFSVVICSLSRRPITP